MGIVQISWSMGEIWIILHIKYRLNLLREFLIENSSVTVELLDNKIGKISTGVYLKSIVEIVNRCQQIRTDCGNWLYIDHFLLRNKCLDFDIFIEIFVREIYIIYIYTYIYIIYIYIYMFICISIIYMSYIYIIQKDWFYWTTKQLKYTTLSVILLTIIRSTYTLHTFFLSQWLFSTLTYLI